MNMRKDDESGSDNSKIATINRSIPLPWLAGIVFALIVHGTSLVLTNQRLSESVLNLTGEVRTLSEQMRKIDTERVDTTWKFNNLTERVDRIERRIETVDTRITDQIRRPVK